MTAPYAADTPDILRQSHQQVVRAVATHPDFEAPITLDLKDVTLDWQERRAPRVEATLTCALPSDAEVNLLDPRAGVRIEIETGYVRPGGTEDVHLIADLGLRNRVISRPANEIRLRATGDELLVIDGSPSAKSAVSTSTHFDAIKTLVYQTISPYPTFTNTISGGAVAVDPVNDRWSTIQDIADRIDAQIYDDGLRDWYFKPTPVITGTPSLYLTVGEDGTVLNTDETLSRDEWFNYVWLRYEWTDSLGANQRVDATAYVESGPYSVTGPAQKRILEDRREVPTTQAQANAAAATVLNRALSKGFTYSLTAVAAYWLRPGMTVAVTLPGRPEEKHLVSAVVFSPKDGTMTLQTRVPIPVSAESGLPATTTPPAAPKVEDPAPPVKQSYTTVWTANASDTYRSTGVKRTDADGDMVQGYSSSGSINGNQRGIAIFTGTATSGSHSGQSITTALSGASVSKIEVWLFANHWWSGAGGTARIGYYNGTTVPASFTGGSPYVSSAKWPRNQGRWVNITNTNFAKALLAGTARGITVGPAPSSSSEYYGRFNGASASSGKPLLRITYAK